MDVNLKSVFFLSQAVARHMLADGRGGKIINIASMLSFQGGIRIPSYTASKSGLAGLTRLLACEWAAQGHQRQRHRAGLFRDQQHRRPCAPTRSAAREILGAHSRRPLGRSAGDRRRRGVPRLARGGLRPRRHPAGRRRLARALRRNDGETGWHAWETPSPSTGQPHGSRPATACDARCSATTSGVMMVRVVFRAGAVGPEHSHPHVQCSLVESGVFDITIAGRTERLRAGDSFLVESNALHGAVAVEAGTLARRVRADAGGVCGVGANGGARPSPLPACGERVRPAAEQAERSEAGVRGQCRKRRPAEAVAPLFVAAPSPSPASQACRLRRPSPRKRGEAKGALFNYPFAIRHSLTPA